MGPLVCSVPLSTVSRTMILHFIVMAVASALRMLTHSTGTNDLVPGSLLQESINFDYDTEPGLITIQKIAIGQIKLENQKNNKRKNVWSLHDKAMVAFLENFDEFSNTLIPTIFKKNNQNSNHSRRSQLKSVELIKNKVNIEKTKHILSELDEHKHSRHRYQKVKFEDVINSKDLFAKCNEFSFPFLLEEAFRLTLVKFMDQATSQFWLEKEVVSDRNFNQVRNQKKIKKEIKKYRMEFEDGFNKIKNKIQKYIIPTNYPNEVQIYRPQIGQNWRPIAKSYSENFKFLLEKLIPYIEQNGPAFPEKLKEEFTTQLTQKEVYTNLPGEEQLKLLEELVLLYQQIIVQRIVLDRNGNPSKDLVQNPQFIKLSNDKMQDLANDILKKLRTNFNFKKQKGQLYFEEIFEEESEAKKEQNKKQMLEIENQIKMINEMEEKKNNIALEKLTYLFEKEKEKKTYFPSIPRLVTKSLLGPIVDRQNKVKVGWLNFEKKKKIPW